MSEEQRFDQGQLLFGWRQNGFALSFEAKSQLGAPAKVRHAQGQIDVTYPWEAKELVAVLINDVA